ncbi:hypothetical protein FRC19_010459 [Serendipita sp. 401]|nr:hypothetical protein FRC19_010459 [Serendipita sp. 401]
MSLSHIPTDSTYADQVMSDEARHLSPTNVVGRVDSNTQEQAVATIEPSLYRHIDGSPHATFNDDKASPMSMSPAVVTVPSTNFPQFLEGTNKESYDTLNPFQRERSHYIIQNPSEDRSTSVTAHQAEVKEQWSPMDVDMDMDIDMDCPQELTTPSMLDPTVPNLKPSRSLISFLIVHYRSWMDISYVLSPILIALDLWARILSVFQ